MKNRKFKKETLGILLHSLVFLNLGVCTLCLFIVKPFWFHKEWFMFVFIITCLFLCIYSFSIIYLLYKKISEGKVPSLYRFRYLYPFVFLAVNGLLAFVIAGAGTSILKPTFQYVYYAWRLPYLLALAVFHSYLTVVIFQRGRGGKLLVKLRSIVGSAGTAFAVGLFLFNAAEHISAGDNRVFPNDVVEKRSPVDFVNPVAGSHEPVVNQGLLPLVAFPYGNAAFAPMNQDTELAGESYRYYNRKITGFLFLRRYPDGRGFFPQGAVMAGTGKVKFLREKRGLKYRHRDEISSPHFYRIILKPGSSRGISGEMTTARRSGMMRFVFNGKETPWLVIDAGSFHKGSVEFFIKGTQGEITGRISTPLKEPGHHGSVVVETFFVIQSDVLPAESGTFKRETYYKGGSAEKNRRVGAVFRFASREIKKVHLRFGTSSLSIDDARNNIRREIGRNDFETIKKNARMAWEKALDIPLVPSAGEKEKGKYYTDMYRDILREPAEQ